MRTAPASLAIAIDPVTRAAIEWLVQEHAWLIDHGRADELPNLYTEDGRVIGIGADKIGRATIAAWAQERAAMTARLSRHAQSNLRLSPGEGGLVHGTLLLTLYRHDGPGMGPAFPLLIAEYEDTYAEGGDGAWRFAERRLSVLFGAA
ncbi:nuclear transport factor 2 family protein [Muricoccus aerilatus]|uniref:nuclear transport factor 2 family protein n=1 Tax=Muricoccus aerilatus TaxID=452982 RepID=UPI000B251713|nr:nuclear transport factor 2 family protein [Roseomonas aerilata]